jgi:ABC-type glutathione transport system ATPase component
MSLLEIKGLSVQFETARRIHAVEGVDLSVEPRTCTAIVGESGSGKSQLLLACTGLLAANGRATGSVCYDGIELLGPGDPAARIRGRGIGFVFQDASGSLTPHRRIGASRRSGRRCTGDAPHFRCRTHARACAASDARRCLAAIHTNCRAACAMLRLPRHGRSRGSCSPTSPRLRST